MRKLYFTLCLSAVALLFSCGNEKQPEAPTPAEKPEQEERVDTLAMLVMQVQKCSRLYTTEYRVHKIVTHDDQLALKGKLFSKDYNINLPLGKRKVAIPIDATMKAYIDFADFSAANVRRTPTHIELILPDPHIVTYRYGGGVVFGEQRCHLRQAALLRDVVGENEDTVVFCLGDGLRQVVLYVLGYYHSLLHKFLILVMDWLGVLPSATFLLTCCLSPRVSSQSPSTATSVRTAPWRSVVQQRSSSL